MNSKELFTKLEINIYDAILKDVYIDYKVLDYQKNRYMNAVKEFERIFGEHEVEIYSAPGRSEIGGNHTDHQQGMVLAASVNVDIISVVSKTDAHEIQIFSEGYEMITVSLDELLQKDEEYGTTISLIKGIVHRMKDLGYNVGGFIGYFTSDVLSGSGLSSSAAFETIIGTILSGLYNSGNVSPVVIAQIGQYAENVYFGKPSGLM